MTRIFAIATVAGLLSAGALAQGLGQGRAVVRPRVPNTLRILNQRVPEVRLQDTPLDQVMDWLGEFTDMNISVRWQMLEDNGIERETPISVQARNLRLSQLLWLIMNEAGGSDIKLAYRASGSLLILSTEDDLSQEMITKIYDVSDLLVRIPRANRQAAFDVTQGLGQGGQGGAGGGGGGGGGGMFGQGGQGQQGQDQYGNDQDGETLMEDLIDLIQQAVEPDSWADNGGRGTIVSFQRNIIVRNTILVHQRLGGYVSEDEIAGP